MAEVAILTGNDKDAIGENRRLKEELLALGVDVRFVDYNESVVLMDDTAMSQGVPVLTLGEKQNIKPDAVIIRINEPDFDTVTKAKRFMEAFNKLKVPMTASTSAVDSCKDKIATHDKLVAAGIPTPRTAMPTSTDAIEIAKVLEFVEPNPHRPVMIKNIFGTKGIGVARAGSRKSALPFVQLLVDAGVQILAQEYIETKRDGFYRDKRLLVVGATVVASMTRLSSTDFRTNLSLSESAGGISDAYGKPLRATARDKDLAVRTAQALGLLIAGIDILPRAKGGSYVDDVNLSPGFLIESVTNTNVAGAIALLGYQLASDSSSHS